MNDRPFDVISIKSRITADNDAIAAEVRELMKEKKIFFMNLMASPGAGKTTTLVRTINALKDKYRIGVIEADVDSTVDAQAIHETGVKVIQIHNGGSCHMDADMTVQGIRGLGMDDLDVVFLENIGSRKRALTLNPNIKIFPVSAKTGEGMEDLENWLGSLII